MYNPRSRDDDNNALSTKIVRDCLTNYKIIEDDTRKCLLPTIEKEEISKEYSIKIEIEEIDSSLKK